MRPAHEITAEEENFRVTPQGVIRRDPIKPESEGTIVLLPFRITHYELDCDGSLMAGLAGLSREDWGTGTFSITESGWTARGISINSALVVSEDELLSLLDHKSQK